MKKPKVVSELKEFILRGNMVDLAVGVIIGGAFNTLVSTLVNDIIMPVISLFTGKIDFTNLFIALDGGKYKTLAEAQEAGAATVNYGSFITGLINFVIMATVVFFIVKFINKLRRPKKEVEQVAPTTKVCPYCKTEISINATRCPNCTSELSVEE